MTRPAPPAPTRTEILTVAAVLYLAMGAGAMLLGWWLGQPWPRLRPVPIPTAVALGSAALVVALSRRLASREGWFRDMAWEFRAVLGDLRAADVLGLAVLSGFFEEWLFRGVLLAWMGPVASTLLFGLLHVPTSRALRPWTLFAVLVGAWLAWLQIWSGSLLPPVLCHVAINAGNLGWIVSMEEGSGP